MEQCSAKALRELKFSKLRFKCLKELTLIHKIENTKGDTRRRFSKTERTRVQKYLCIAFLRLFISNADAIRIFFSPLVQLVKSSLRLGSGSLHKVWISPPTQLRMPAFRLPPDIDYNVIKLMNISFGLEL